MDTYSVHVIGCPIIGPELGGRLYVSQGVRDLDGCLPSGSPIVVPVDHWAPIAPAELVRLRTETVRSENREEYVGIFRISVSALEICSKFLKWYFGGASKSRDQCQARAQALRLFEAIYIEPGHSAHDFLGVVPGQPNEATTTIDTATGRRVGMHFDNFDNLSVWEKQRARNRISINVGSQSRYFLFVPKQAHAILDAVKSKQGTGDIAERLELSHRELAFHYFRFFPSDPVYRIELKPGEGYLAPTENIIHDGSTLGTSAPDWSLTWTGNLQWAHLRAFK